MNLFINLVFGIALTFCGIASAELYAPQPRDLFVKDSYMVTSKPAEPGRVPVILPPVTDFQVKRSRPTPKFGEHSSGQSKDQLAAMLGIRGKVLSIFEANNAAHLQIDSAQAEKLRADPRVLNVEQDRVVVAAQTVQNNPGWGLDRMDQPNTALNNQYVFNSNGTGQTIYVLDSGLDLINPIVAAEFGNRASVIWDVNGQGGGDCYGHGTQVASIAAGATYGMAKGATVIAAKINSGCTSGGLVSTSVLAFDWLAVNAPRGTIVNWSNGLRGLTQCQPAISTTLENSIRSAVNAGIIVIVAAGNDGCNTADFSPTRIPEAFVVGATDNSRLAFGQDARASFSRFGTNLSTFAPGNFVAAMNFNGQVASVQGTSFSAPYVAGLFAAACQNFAPFCSNPANTVIDIYNAARGIGTLGTVVDPGGAALPTGTQSRFISRQPW